MVFYSSVQFQPSSPTTLTIEISGLSRRLKVWLGHCLLNALAFNNCSSAISISATFRVLFLFSSDLIRCNRCFRHFDFYPLPVMAGSLFAIHPMLTDRVMVAVEATTAVSQTVAVVCTSWSICHVYTTVGIVISTVIVRPPLTRLLAKRLSSFSRTIFGMNIVEVDVVVASIDSVVVMVREKCVRITACVPHSCQPQVQRRRHQHKHFSSPQ